MSYFLDTNILIMILLGDTDNISKEVQKIFTNSQILYASVISINEVVQLCRKKKFLEDIVHANENKLKNNKKEIVFSEPEEFLNIFFDRLDFVKFLSYEKDYAKEVAKISYIGKHKDPNDLAIMAHASFLNMPLITTDTLLPAYGEKYSHINIIFNKKKN